MSKQLYPFDLAEITSTLLIDPKKLGVDITEEQHMQFVEEIAIAITNNFDGIVNCISQREDPKGTYLSDIYNMPIVSISPSFDCDDTVFKFNDVIGWEDEDLSFDMPTQEQANEFRLAVPTLFSNNSTKLYEVSFYIVEKGENPEDGTITATYETEKDAYLRLALYLHDNVDSSEHDERMLDLSLTERRRFIINYNVEELNAYCEWAFFQRLTDDNLIGNYSITEC